jgi:hypothetical protein
MELEKLLKRVDRYINLENARHAAARRLKIHLIIRGDDGRYWVAVPAVTEKLHRMGYEYVE